MSNASPSRVTTLVVGIAIAAATAAVLWPRSQFAYPSSVADVLSQQLSDSVIRVQGLMPKDSLCKVDRECEDHLRLMDHEMPDSGSVPTLEVRYTQCRIPDTAGCALPAFNLEVVVEGRRESPGRLLASTLFVKCQLTEPSPDAGMSLSDTIPPCE